MEHHKTYIELGKCKVDRVDWPLLGRAMPFCAKDILSACFLKLMHACAFAKR